MNVKYSVKESPIGGRMPYLTVYVGRLRLAVGWVTQWTDGIKWFFYRSNDTRWIEGGSRNWQLHLGRFRVGFGYTGGHW